MQVKIRKITLNDNPQMRDVIRTVLEEHGITMQGTAYHDDSLNDMYTFHTRPNAVYFVAEANGKIMGGAGIYPTQGLPSGTCELVKMYILKEARGLGIGKKLLVMCKAFARGHGYKKIYLETMPELQNAIHMYASQGFEKIDGPMGNTGHFACELRMLLSL